ncbi:hypothetical protein BDK51DRAFT_31478 [Blyttiomyces helicus]|uniref:Exocyst complex component EXO84 n=1 Tax=Blyttiomyces helicus TaxID=388810 RepID=A0A4P9VW65_9FUNG|nr:hypothetical protein BDK51DRAFT_31478 [Blyttiomyces helicus]|eukprot:RKO83939.1 hypothetical protein BDK51DRAFT_31478 [Blyttiomyces helicus]
MDKDSRTSASARATPFNPKKPAPVTTPAASSVPAPSGVRLPIVDVIKFADEDFSAETYVYGILTGNLEDGVRGYHAALRNAKDGAAADLQRNVYRNYNEFVLESDMLVLREWLNDLKTVHDGLRPEPPAAEKMPEESESNDAPVPVQQQSASSLFVLAKQTAESHNEARISQMKALYESMEGLQKVLPFYAGRFVVRDGSKSRCWEVNPTTFKQKQAIHFFLLSDTLVIATKKKNIMSGKSRLAVEKCWGILDLAVIDIKDSAESEGWRETSMKRGQFALAGITPPMWRQIVNSRSILEWKLSIAESYVTNAFKVMKHPDVFIYRSEKIEEKRGVLGGLKRLTDDLMSQKRKEMDLIMERKSR